MDGVSGWIGAWAVFGEIEGELGVNINKTQEPGRLSRVCGMAVPITWAAALRPLAAPHAPHAAARVCSEPRG